MLSVCFNYIFHNKQIIFLGKNHFGYKDQTELKVATNGEEATIPQEQLEEKYRDLLGDGTIEGEGKIKE